MWAKLYYKTNKKAKTVLCSVIKHSRKWQEHSRSREKHSPAVRVHPTLLSWSRHFLACFITEQSTVLAFLFVNYVWIKGCKLLTNNCSFWRLMQCSQLDNGMSIDIGANTFTYTLKDTLHITKPPLLGKVAIWSSHKIFQFKHWCEQFNLTISPNEIWCIVRLWSILTLSTTHALITKTRWLMTYHQLFLTSFEVLKRHLKNKFFTVLYTTVKSCLWKISSISLLFCYLHRNIPNCTCFYLYTCSKPNRKVRFLPILRSCYNWNVYILKLCMHLQIIRIRQDSISILCKVN